MQPVPTADSDQTPQENPSLADSRLTTQHGSDLVHDRVSDSLRHAEVGDHCALGASHGQVDDGESGPVQRLSTILSVHSSPSVDRIRQYEAVMATSPRKQPVEVGFKVIASSSPPRVSIESFPNGSSSRYLNNDHPVDSHSTSRGLDPHLVSLASAIAVRHHPGFSPLSQSSHNASRVENCVFPLFSGAS